jgi:3-phosphoshikimate 1-carboxyvinyltransferase
MSLPPVIEIVPLDHPVRARIAVPGSKSITNRALILAALSEGETTLDGALWSEDTQVMVEALQKLGFKLSVAPDPVEACNRTIVIQGEGGKIPLTGTRDRPLDLFVGNAGTAARFLAALACLGKGTYRLSGVARMHERPQAPLLNALRELGYEIDSQENTLPAVIHGSGPRAGKCHVSIEQSSQFASGLILSAERGGWNVQINGENSEESPYVMMTWELAKVFPRKGGVFDIDPDASSASYFWAADWLVSHPPDPPTSGSESEIRLASHHTFTEGWQVDSRFEEFVHTWPQPLSRATHLGDSIMTAIVLAPFRGGTFTDLGRLRVQECERVSALRTELTRCGGRVTEQGDTLTIEPSSLHGAQVATYDDHRMAMCFATLGLKVPGMKIENPACVKKTFPNFFQKLAAPTPEGLGATVLDARTGRKLALAELFAA